MKPYLENVDPGDERPEGLAAIRGLLAKPVFLIGEVLAAFERCGIFREIEKKNATTNED
jgi:hypothetical protein